MGLVNAIATYGLILLCFVAAAGIAIFLGITLRKRKDAQMEQENKE